MNKKSKFLFLGLTLLILVISVGAISATDSNNTQSSISDNGSINIAHDISNDKVLNDNKFSNTKDNSKNENLNKKAINNKQSKKAVESTQTATDYETLKTSWNNIKTDGDNTTDYIINVKNGNYNFDEQLEINNESNIKSITVNGEDVDKTIFDGQNKTRFFNINTTTLKISFNNITFKDGFNNTQAGAIYDRCDMNINNSKFINNRVYSESEDIYTVRGGAIYIYAGNTTINHSSFINNTAESTTTGYCTINGGAIAYNSISGRYMFVNITFCDFINNSVIANENSSYPEYAVGGVFATSDGRTAKIGGLNATNCNFIGNHANVGSVGSFSYVNRFRPTIVKDCVIDKNTGSKLFDYSGSDGIDVSSNYYPDGSATSIITLVNGEYPIKVLNQRTNNITINMITELTSYDEPTTMIGNYYQIPVKSSSTLINTSNISLSADNKYTAIINIGNLPVNHENITLYAGNLEVAKIIWDYTNVEFNNITAKPGNNIILNATFKTSDNKLIPNGKVAFKINGCTVGHSNIEFGTATLNYTIPENYSAKDYILTVVYGGSNQFIEVRTNSTLHLEKLATTTNLTTTIEGNTLKITVDPKDEKGNTVKTGKICVKIEGKTLQNLKINGKTQVNFTIPKSWNNREIKVIAIYGENNNHKQSRMEIKTKLILNTKTTKTEEVINNYYVSYLTGSDSNTGSQTSPFKTIQKAITTIQNNGQTANVYLDGNFKGVGNTNLTVPGNLKINFIGVGNSSIDGEVNYTIKTQLTDGEYYWGSTTIWYPYNNGTGNWAMNITGGNGIITITNFTIKNCWSPGGTDIVSYKTASITNYGNLEVNNVSFIFNHGGVGASIKNNNGGNLKVINSLFEANRKSNSTGNYGAGVYNNGTATIINSTFQKNYARWGTITNDKNLTIINSTIRDNIGYDGGSTFKTGSAITINTGSTTFDVTYNVTSITTIIDGCYFTNNDQLDIYADEGDLNITNSIFNKSTGIVVPQASAKNIKYNIINNTIDSPIGSSLYTSLSSTDYQILAFRLYGNYIYLIENNTVLNLASSDSKALELQSSNSTIKNNTFTRAIQITGSNNTITGNNITTTMDTYTITIPDTTSRFNIIKNNYLSTNGLKGNAAIDSNSNFNTIENNIPETQSISINDDTFYKYFDDDGNILPAFNSINLIEISGLLSNKNINLNREVSITQTNNKVTLLNITININSPNLSISGLNVENKNNNSVIIINANNITVTQTKLLTNSNYSIILNGNDNNISSNELVADILTGNEAVLSNGTNVIELNTPTYKNYVLTDTTYSTYFDNNGKIKLEYNEDNIHFLIKDSMHNKNMIFNLNNTITIVGSEKLVLYNTTITVEDTTYLNMSYVNIENTNNKVALQLNVAKSLISYNNITTNTNAINIENVTGCEVKIQNNNIIANSTENVTTINIINTNGSSNVRTTSEISNNVIITYGPALKMNNGNIATVSIGLYNSSGFKIRQNTITTNYGKIIDSDNIIASISMRSPIKSNLTETQYNTIITNGDDKAISLNMQNYSADIYSENFITNAKTSISILANGSDTTGKSIYGSFKNTGSNCYGVILINSKNIKIYSSQRINAENIVGFLVINSSNNLTFTRNNIVLNGSDVVAFKFINSSNLNITDNNITTTTNGTNSDVIFINSSSNSLQVNTIITDNLYTIQLDKDSSNNLIKNNTLYASTTFGSNSVKSENSTNRIHINLPGEVVSYIFLNDKTYSQFFDENGTLRDKVPTGITIQLTGNLHGKVLNITRPINLVADKTELINSKLIIDSSAKNTNLTGIKLSADSSVIILADESNINISSMNITNTVSDNIDLILIRGNNNNIIIDLVTVSSSRDLNSNISVVKVTGKNNKVNINSLRASYFNEVNAILLENTLNNSIFFNNPMFSSCNDTTFILLKNSDKNNITFGSIYTLSNIDKLTEITLINSSNNYIGGDFSTYYGASELSVLRVLNNQMQIHSYLKYQDYQLQKHLL
ncbi:beta strand repeat-containing protein [Methanosphaera cuniculi]|uniref:Member of asn/thr-rich large protein family n=1 Tax=Methanosphaera cuniculi TaxID=1077256 RepID=A0A2A2HEW9_9EURY|nr:hypothetical protein [Methanosphaera cuniculi]PAV07814.1 hypothetical protein ASJ82_02480 [Methanosphaera cuniculi]PWL07977.1 hypothetical protein MSCUN_12200 [Methanosphaera cuniculi]